MSRLNEMTQALHRQSPRSPWLLELSMPSVALGRGLPRNETAAQPHAANANHPEVGMLVNLVRAAVRAVKRHRTARLLRQLDSRLLDDIGVARDEIDTVVTKAVNAAAAQQGSHAMPQFEIVATLRSAWQRRTAIAELQRLSDHTLGDIGIERGRIALSVDTMMAKDDAAPAPTPTPTPTVRAAKAAKPTAPKPVGTAAPAHKVAA